MTTSVPEFEANDLHLRQLQAAAASTVQSWFKAYSRTVGRALDWCGVTEREDQAELTQDVFFLAYRTLVRGEQIGSPRAWLWECARKHASNYRHKARRRRPHIGGDLLVHGKDPEQITSDRETLKIALAGLTEYAQDIVIDIRVEGVSWDEAAQERGITIDQARYAYQCAVLEMKKALYDSGRKMPLKSDKRGQQGRVESVPSNKTNMGIKVGAPRAKTSK